MRSWILKHSRNLACAGWFAVIATIIIKIVLQGAKRSVYPLFLCGGSHWVDGLSVYAGKCENFQYWPGFAAFMSLFSFMPYTIGSYVWSAFNIAVLLSGAIIFAKYFIINDKGKYRWIFILLLIPMSFEGLINQQSNPLLAGLVLWGIGMAGAKRWWLASAFLLIPGFVKVAPLCFAMLILAVYPRQLLWRMLIVALLLLAMPFALQSSDYVLGQYKEWGQVLGGEAGERWAYRDAYVWYELLTMGHVSNHEKVVDMGWFRIVQLLMAGVAFCGTVFAVYIRKFSKEITGALAASWAGWWLIMFGPSTEVATCVMGAGVAVWCLVMSYKTRMFPLMMIGFSLLCIGSSGEVEFELGQMFGDWNKGILSLGTLLWGICILVFSIKVNDNCCHD